VLGCCAGLATHAFGDQMAHKSAVRYLLVALASGLLSAGAEAQPAARGPPAVGVARAQHQQITESDEFIGRIQAIGRVALVARVTAFLEQQLFVEGSRGFSKQIKLARRRSPSGRLRTENRIVIRRSPLLPLRLLALARPPQRQHRDALSVQGGPQGKLPPQGRLIPNDANP
jgi:hypothetical protein